MALFRALCGTRKVIASYSRISSALISTSKKTKDTLVFPDDALPKRGPPPPVTPEDFAETKPKNWVSYGYDEHNYEEDKFLAKLFSFLVLTVLTFGMTFIYNYAPDPGNTDWVLREAYLELNRREKLGLPIIDKNLIDPATVELPTDEELGDTEIII